jgi:hypothetical protein
MKYFNILSDAEIDKIRIKSYLPIGVDEDFFIEATHTYLNAKNNKVGCVIAKYQGLRDDDEKSHVVVVNENNVRLLLKKSDLSK